MLLDTHVWRWVIEGTPDLAHATLRRIDQSAGRGELFVSVISAWEIAMLEAKGRVAFDIPCLEWVREALAAPIRLAWLSPEIAVESTRLPPPMQRDPADRILIATARLEGLSVLTRDRRILDYAANGHVRALAC